jgi:F-type H+-transporting ATPase subunit a
MHKLTVFLNENFGAAANQVLDALHTPAADRIHPWQEWFITEILVFLILVAAAALIRAWLSAVKPGKSQLVVETVYGFLRDQADEVGIHHASNFAPFFATLFLFILVCNLIGIIPVFESPTMVPWVPAGLAVVTFIYYNYMGFREQGVARYLKHFAGPIWWLAPLMIPIEIVSHFARPLSLSIRLFANMFAGEQVTMAFLKLTLLLAPAIFMGLHVFVSLLQAYIFALLAMIYVAGAIAHEH